jgi:predicted dienelactone hydrolase
VRPLEAGLLATTVLALLVLAAPLAGRARRARVLALLPLPVLVAQLLAEGARWQMLPGYALSALFALAWLMRTAGRVRGSRTDTRVVTGLAVAALVVAIAAPLAVPVFSFPRPTGPYAVGTQTYHWVDDARPDIFTADPADRRELVVQVWYPAVDEPAAPRAPYVADGRALAPLARLMRLPGPTFQYFDQVRTNAVAGAPAAREDVRYPVLLFSHGRGGYRQHNTAQVEELVSHGYVVAAIDHPHAAAGVVFPDGRQVDMDSRMLDRRFIDRVIPYLAQDASFTLDRLADLDRSDDVLAGRLDLNHVGMFGVSLGGAVTGETCKSDARVLACLPVDVFLPADVVEQGLRQPVMWISRDAATMRREGWSESDVEETHRTMRAVFDRLPAAGYIVLVPGMYHTDFSDFPLVSPLSKPLGLSGSLDAHRAREIPDVYALAFFDKHLKGRQAPLLDAPSERFPEVLFERR